MLNASGGNGETLGIFVAFVLQSAGTNVFVYKLKPHFWGGNFNVSVLVKAQTEP